MHGAYRQLETAKADKSSLVFKGLCYCDKMFALEESWADLSLQDRLMKRQDELEPLMAEFFDWCRRQAVLQALSWDVPLTIALSMKKRLELYLKMVVSSYPIIWRNVRSSLWL